MKKILCHGVFDILHLGHKRYLEKALALGDYLIVSVTADEHVRKGPGQPLFTVEQRAEMLRALRFVDRVVISHQRSAVGMIYEHVPDIYAKGPDYQAGDASGNLEAERQAVESYGGKLVIVQSEPVFSSTEIITGELLRKKREAVICR